MKIPLDIEEYYNNRFRTHFNEWVEQTLAHEHPGEGIYIPYGDLQVEKLSHIPRNEIQFFFCSLGWSVLLDQVMYTYFKNDYPYFQSMTLYPKIEVGITGMKMSPDYIYKGYLNKEIINFFLSDLKEFFKTHTFIKANWERVLNAVLEDKDVNIEIKNEILKVVKL